MFIIPITQMMPMESIFAEQGSKQENLLKNGTAFSDILSDAIQNTRETQAVSNQDAYDLAMGNTDDLSSIMIHSAQASTALDATVQLTTRAVNAYKEVMQMQV